MQLAFVCSGNTCRSPLALAAWRLATRELDLPQSFYAMSAGLCAVQDAPAAEFARQIAREWGENLDEHRAQLFMPHHAQFDLLLTMTQDQADVLRSHFSLDENRVRLLGSYVPHREKVPDLASSSLWSELTRDYTPTSHDIFDPYGESFDAYHACAAQIRRCVWELAQVLKRGE